MASFASFYRIYLKYCAIEKRILFFMIFQIDFMPKNLGPDQYYHDCKTFQFVSTRLKLISGMTQKGFYTYLWKIAPAK